MVQLAGYKSPFDCVVRHFNTESVKVSLVPIEHESFVLTDHQY